MQRTRVIICCSQRCNTTPWKPSPLRDKEHEFTMLLVTPQKSWLTAQTRLLYKQRCIINSNTNKHSWYSYKRNILMWEKIPLSENSQRSAGDVNIHYKAQTIYQPSIFFNVHNNVKFCQHNFFIKKEKKLQFCSILCVQEDDYANGHAISCIFRQARKLSNIECLTLCQKFWNPGHLAQQNDADFLRASP